MSFRHTVGVVVGVTLIVLAGPATLAHAEPGSFEYYTVGGNTDLIEDAVPHQCYQLGDASEPAIGGFNGTVFGAQLYADANCGYPTQFAAPQTPFEGPPVSSVRFAP